MPRQDHRSLNAIEHQLLVHDFPFEYRGHYLKMATKSCRRSAIPIHPAPDLKAFAIA
jgi:hypothetical protein